MSHKTPEGKKCGLIDGHKKRPKPDKPVNPLECIHGCKKERCGNCYLESTEPNTFVTTKMKPHKRPMTPLSEQHAQQDKQELNGHACTTGECKKCDKPEWEDYKQHLYELDEIEFAAARDKIFSKVDEFLTQAVEEVRKEMMDENRPVSKHLWDCVKKDVEEELTIKLRSELQKEILSLLDKALAEVHGGGNGRRILEELRDSLFKGRAEETKKKIKQEVEVLRSGKSREEIIGELDTIEKNHANS